MFDYLTNLKIFSICLYVKIFLYFCNI